MRQVFLASLAVPGGFHDGDWVESKDQDPDGEIRLLQLADVGDGFFRDRSDRRINELTFGRLNCSPVWAGDVLIARMPDPLGRACIVPQGIGRAVTVVDVAVLRCDDTKADRRYVTYAINATPSRSFMESLQDGATRQRIPRKRLGRVQIPLPELPEQRAIADYLDRETACIDTLIEEQQRLIEMLRERRLAVIAGEFDAPATTRLRYAIQFAQTGPFGTQLSAEEYVEDGVPVVNPTHIKRGSITPDAMISVTLEKATDLRRHQLEVGDIVLGRKGEVDKSALVSEAEAGYVCGSDSMLLRPSENIDPSYLWWFFQSPESHSQLEQWSVGSTVAGLNQTTISKVVLPLPSSVEQRRIAQHLDKHIAKTDTLIAETERFIEFSRERRSALITAAVTGQIDVREMA